jgi:hypothetical protein
MEGSGGWSLEAGGVAVAEERKRRGSGCEKRVEREWVDVLHQHVGAAVKTGRVDVRAPSGWQRVLCAHGGELVDGAKAGRYARAVRSVEDMVF